ncbi:MAG TPA: ABC transporter substrate-binding protein [Alphaproteobacteria bacterium]|jgi:putative ABC transport system substrate-binding protein
MNLHLGLSRRAVLALLGGGAALSAGASRALAQGAAQGKRPPFRIYMALFRGFEDAAQGFQDYLAERGVPVTYIVRNADQNVARIPEMVAEIKAMKPDLVLSWGTGMTLGLVGPYDAPDPKKYVTETPVVFMIVSQPVGAKIVPDLLKPGRNVTGANYLIPEETQLNFARRYIPFKKVAVVYNPAEQNAALTVTELWRLSGTMGFELVDAPLPLDPTGRPIVAEIGDVLDNVAAHKPDMVYLGPDSFLNDLRKEFTEAAVARRLPVFAAGEGPVRTGSALMGVVNRYHTVGQLAALKAEQVLMGRPASDIPIEMPERFSVIVNIRVAKALKLYPPMTLLKFAEIAS